MASLQSRIFYFMIKNGHLFRFRLKPEAWDVHTSIPQFRARWERQSARTRVAAGVEVEPVTVAGMRAEWLRPVGAAKDKVILYMIGGGYVSGSCNDHRAFVSKIAAGSGITTLLFEHRLAPEDPYPAALDDAVAAYRWLLSEGIRPTDIVIAGESAGGGLGLATLLALRDQSIPLPAAAAVLSPYTDLELTGDSHRTKRNVCVSPPGMASIVARAYVGDHDPCLPWISPLYGDLHGLPPLYICAGDYDLLFDDSTRFAAKAKAAGVDVTFRVGVGMIHCYPLLAPLFPEATQALEEMCAFIQTHLVQERM